MEIYRPTKRQGKYPPLVTDSEMKSCLKYKKHSEVIWQKRWFYSVIPATMTIFSDAEPVRVAQRSIAKDIGVKQPSERALNAIHCFSICEYLIFLKGQLSSLWINVSKRETASPVFKNELRISFVVNKVFLLPILWGYIENDRYSSWYTFCFHQPFSHLLMTGQYRCWIRPMPELVVTILCQIKVLICWVGVVGIELQTVSLHLWYNKKYFILITFILPGSSRRSWIHSCHRG